MHVLTFEILGKFGLQKMRCLDNFCYHERVKSVEPVNQINVLIIVVVNNPNANIFHLSR